MLLAVGIVVHSWVRWGILLALLGALWISLSGLREKRSWTERDSKVVRAWVGLSDLQFLIGMILYFGISPIAAIARADPDGASPVIRFFGFAHPIAMTLYVVGAHITWVLVRRVDTNDSASRYRRLLIGAIVCIAILVCAIPWPFLEHGRPLFRP